MKLDFSELRGSHMPSAFNLVIVVTETHRLFGTEEDWYQLFECWYSIILLVSMGEVIVSIVYQLLFNKL